VSARSQGTRVGWLLALGVLAALGWWFWHGDSGAIGEGPSKSDPSPIDDREGCRASATALERTTEIESTREPRAVVEPGEAELEGRVISIDGIPADKHEVVIWHEVLGKRRLELTVKGGESTSLSVVMPAPQGK
jgi:hypothetical protein